MKTLLLLRHAKSSWDDPGLDDHERPLNERGQTAARQVGAFLTEQGYRPQLVLCSTARRTRETLALALPANHTDVRFTHDLYLAAPDQILSALRTLEDEAESVMIVAHSPGTEQLALLLSRCDGPREERASRDKIAEKFPTGALAVLELPSETWAAVEPGSGRLTAFVRPRDL